MKKKIVFKNENEKQSAIDDNPSMRIVEESRHIVGKDEDDNPIYEEFVVFSDEAIKPTMEERVTQLEADIKILREAT